LGSGQFALLLAEFSRVIKISGVEIDARLVSNAKRLLEPYKDKVEIEISQYNGHNLPDSIFDHDVVFLIDVLHHIPRKDQMKFLKDVYRKMKDGSYFVIKDIDGGSPLVLFNKIHDLLFAQEIGNELSLREVTKRVGEMGFKIEEIVKKRLYVYPHFTLILKK
jgi:SAM-dependent methyltransferase